MSDPSDLEENKHLAAGGHDSSVEHSEGSDTEDELEITKMANMGELSNTLILLDIQKTLKRLTKRIEDPRHGLIPQVSSVEQQADDNQMRIAKLEAENAEFRQNQKIMMGLIQRQCEQLSRQKSKLEDLTVRSMSANIVIHNYDYEIDEKERDLRPVVMGFLRDKMNISPDPREVYVAHRLSENSSSIVVRLNPALKNDIFENIERLSGVKNKENKPVYVADQQPEGVRSRRMDARSLAQEIKDKNKNLPEGQKPKVEIKKDKVFVNKQLQRNPILPPEPKDILDIDKDELEKMEKIKFTETAEQGENGSKFRAVAAKVTSRVEVRRAYKKIRRIYPAATHVMCGYCFKKGPDTFEYGKQDDGEWGGSHRILESIKLKNVTNAAIFVIREFGGIEIGSKRYVHIKQCTEKVITKMGLS